MKNTRKHISLVCLILAAVLIVGCTGTGVAVDSVPVAEPPAEASDTAGETGASVQGEPKYGGEIVAYIGGDPQSLDPAALGANYNATYIVTNIGEGLLRMSATGANYEPAIAESWDISDDGTVYTFHLREGVKFSNGRAVTAADFKYTFERVTDPATMCAKSWVFDTVAGASEFKAGTATEITGIVATDDKTLTITLDKPMSAFLSMMAMPALDVVAKEAVEEYGADFGKNAVLSGPFTIQSWTPNGDVVLAANEEYWAGRPYLDTVRFRIVTDENTRMIEFESGTLDIVWIPVQYMVELSNDPAKKDSIHHADTIHTDFIALNMDNEPFNSSKELRQAIYYCLDMQAIVDYNIGRCSIANGIVPLGMLSAKTTADNMYNLEKAKELMKEAGYENGLPGTYQFLIPAWNNFITTCEIYQQLLKEIGIHIELRPLEDNAYAEALNIGDYDIAWGWNTGEYMDPDSYYYPLYYSENIDGSGNVARYMNEELDKLILEARTETDDAKRVELYNQINAIIDADMPYVYLTHNQYYDICQSYVKNYGPSPADQQNFIRVWIDKGE